nr:PREDICTED: olfactory receptor 51E1-like [Latimeria chalumnae]|eukprot:XP_006010874.1 PREDICTED: olfactory receptor 51E1-like [Latimeria chalumnae]
MEYSHNITTFTLEGFGKASRLHYLYAACLFLLYLLMVSANLLLIAVIVLKKCLHEPMYIFICNLAINALYGSTSVLPKLIVDLVSERKTISNLGCFVQLFFIHSFTGHEILIITVMAYDRYIAIWNPLRYVVIMTKTKISKLLIAVWLYPICVIVICTCLTRRLPLCSLVIQNLYCDNMSVVKLSCVDTSVNNFYGIFVITITAVFPAAVVLFSYMSIFNIFLKATINAKSKFFSTCGTHLLVFFGTVIGNLFVLIQHRLDASSIPSPVIVFMSLEFIMVPPLFNPIIYGMRTEKIRNEIVKLFRKQIHSSLSKPTKSQEINSVPTIVTGRGLVRSM